MRQAIIPVAGLGTRLLPVSLAVPKELLPLGTKPALQWIAEELASSGIEHLILVTSPEKPGMDRLFQPHPELSERLRALGQNTEYDSLWANGVYRDRRISVVIQTAPWGLGHAVACGEQRLVHGPFVVALGDCVMGPPGQNQILRRMLGAFERHQADIVIALEWVPRERVSRYGIADVGISPSDTSKGSEVEPGVFHLRGIVEKPSVETAPSQWAVAARYVFRHPVTPNLDSPADAMGPGREIQLTSAIAKSIERGEKVLGVCLQESERRFDVGSHDSYRRAFQAFSGEPPHGR